MNLIFRRGECYTVILGSEYLLLSTLNPSRYQQCIWLNIWHRNSARFSSCWGCVSKSMQTFTLGIVIDAEMIRNVRVNSEGVEVFRNPNTQSQLQDTAHSAQRSLLFGGFLPLWSPKRPLNSKFEARVVEKVSWRSFLTIGRLFSMSVRARKWSESVSEKPN